MVSRFLLPWLVKPPRNNSDKFAWGQMSTARIFFHWVALRVPADRLESQARFARSAFIVPKRITHRHRDASSVQYGLYHVHNRPSRVHKGQTPRGVDTTQRNIPNARLLSSPRLFSITSGPNVLTPRQTKFNCDSILIRENFRRN